MASETLSVERVCALIAPRLLHDAEEAPANHLISSAVLLPILPSRSASRGSSDATLLFIRRASGLPDHPGQVSFPGGVWEEGDADLYATALRESEEEVGADPGRILRIGALASVSTMEKYWIQPFVSVWPAGDYEPESPEEVDRVFRVPITRLLAADTRTEVEVEVPGARLRVPAFVHDGEVIWGATRRITLDFLARLRWALNDESL